MAETLRLTGSETVTIRESSPDLLEVEGSRSGGGNPPPAHYHPDQDEHFEPHGTPSSDVDSSACSAAPRVTEPESRLLTFR
jgi:hypothetical protein